MNVRAFVVENVYKELWANMRPRIWACVNKVGAKSRTRIEWFAYQKNLNVSSIYGVITRQGDSDLIYYSVCAIQVENVNPKS